MQELPGYLAGLAGGYRRDEVLMCASVLCFWLTEILAGAAEQERSTERGRPLLLHQSACTLL